LTLGLAIALDRPDRTYLLGEELTGTLHVTVPQELDCDQLVVDLCYLFGGKLGRGDGVEATTLVYQGHWAAGTHALSFSVPVSAELPSYQGQLFTVTRMVRASLFPSRGSKVTDVAIIWVACSPRDGAWFHPREQQPPPVALAINDIPIRLTSVRRALETGIGILLGRRRVATLDVQPVVARGGDTVTITAVASYPAQGLGTLRARLRGVEAWPRNGSPKVKIIHSEEFTAQVSSDGRRSTVRIDVPLPEDAISMAERVQWRIQLRGAYGCIDHRDRWQPLWIGPSEASLRRLRGKSTEELAVVTADSERRIQAVAAREWRQGIGAALILILGVGIPIAMIAVGTSATGRLWLAAVLMALAAVIAILVRKKRALDRDFRDRQFRAQRTPPSSMASNTAPTSDLTTEPPAPSGPPPPALMIELVNWGETPASPAVGQLLRNEIVATQRVVLRRGVRGLTFLLAANIVAGLIATSSGLGTGLVIPLYGLSLLALAASLLSAPSGRPLSCYVGMAPVLVVCWLVESTPGAVLSGVAGVAGRSPRDLAAALLLALCVTVVIVRARGSRPEGAHARRLLVLWVFGTSSRMEEIMRALSLQWTYLGPIQYLRGPGSYGDLGRWIAALRRGTRDLYADCLPEVMAHVRRFRFAPNIFGAYSLNSLQCTDAVWRDAVDALLDTTDLVMMDLTAFGPKNQGCAYELGVLIARMPTARFVLVVDGTTDIDLLTTLLHRQWDAMPASSPNRDAGTWPIRLLRIPLRGAETPGRLWSITPMNDLVHLLFEPVAAGSQ